MTGIARTKSVSCDTKRRSGPQFGFIIQDTGPRGLISCLKALEKKARNR